MGSQRLHRLAFLIPLLVVILSAAANAAPVLRELEEVSLDLGGTWRIAYDRRNIGLQKGWQKSRPGDLREIKVPSCYEETPEGAGYDGVVWYFTNFTIPNEFTSKTLYLEFDAVNYACRVWLNGVEIGGHEGGYHRFRLPLGSAARAKEPNDLVVRVVDPGRQPIDGLTLRDIPNAKESWYFNFGGIWGGVRLLGKPALSIEDVSVVADPASGKVAVQLDVEKREGAPRDLPLQIKIVPTREQGREVAAVEQKPALNSGANRLKMELSVANPELWSPDSPRLYRLTATLGNLSRRHMDFGFRSFTIEKGGFQLNGKPVFLKAVLYQPYYPGTLAYPPSEDFARREVQMMKEAGFNLVRFHACVAPPSMLRTADELGLMVLEEPSIGWVYGPSDRIAKPCLAEIADMIARDRNHPSIVAWGTVSQATGDLAKLSGLFARRALQLDSTRPVFGNWPARWTEAAERACFVYLPNRPEPLAIAGGQMFPRFPLSDEEYSRLNTLGTSSPLAFLAAIGSGGMTNLREAVSRFGGREFLEDCQLFKHYRDAAEKDFNERRLQEVFNNPDGLYNQAQEAQLSAAVEMVETLRTNPNLAGYCYSQWRDAAWECGPGVVDVWVNPKRVYGALRRLNQPVYVVIRCTPGCASLDRPVQTQAIVINDGGPSGQYRLELILFRADNRELPRQKIAVELSGAKRVMPVAPVEWRIEGPTGFCRIRAELYDSSNKKIAENERRFLYVASEQWDLSKYEVLAIDPSAQRRSVLAASGVRLLDPPAWPKSQIVLVSATGRIWQSRERFEPLAEALEQINREGGTVLLDCSDGFDSTVGRVRLLSGKTARTAGGFIGRFSFAGGPPWLGWFFARQPMMNEWRSVFPQTALLSDEREWHPALAVVDGYGRFGGFAWAEKAWGMGKVMAFTLPIFGLADRDPTARLICSTLLRHCSDNQRFGSPGGLDRRVILARFDGTGETTASDWWVCGPFACRDLGEGLRRLYPPEKEFLPNRTYPGYDKQNAAWKRCRSTGLGRINFGEVFGERPNAVAYALTNLYVKKETRTVLRLGSDDAIRVFLNGSQVFENPIQRSGSPDQDRLEITLKEGWNQLLLKVVNAADRWEAYVSTDEPVIWSPDRQPPKPAK